MTAAKKLAFDPKECQQWVAQLGQDAAVSVGLLGDSKAKSVVGVCENQEPIAVIESLIQGHHNHVCQATNVAFEAEVQCSARMSHEPEVFFSRPIATILDPVQPSLETEKHFKKYEGHFNNISDKRKLIGELNVELEKLSPSGALRSEVSLITDELYTNAVYNAPFYDNNKKQVQVSRDDEGVCLITQKPGRLFLGSDGSRLVIGCEDKYGSLDPTSLFARIRDCYVKGVADNMNMGTGGAGIGSYLVFNACASYYVAVEAGVRTVVCCTIPLGMGNRKRSALPKNIHHLFVDREKK